MAEPRFHINSKGNTGACNATKRPCPLGFSLEEHYATEEEARTAYEKTQGSALLSKLRRSPLKKFTLASAALTASFSLSGCHVEAPSMGDVTEAATPVATTPADPRPTPTSAGDVLKGVVRGGSEEALRKAKEAADNHQDEIAKAKEATGKAGARATAFVKDHQGEARAVTEELSRVAQGPGKDALNKVLEDSSYSVPSVPGGVSADAPNGIVLFQGKPLTVSQAEVNDALEKLKTIPVRPSNEGVDYDRARDYGGDFKPGVVGRLEHRDVPNATFKSSSNKSRAHEGSYIDPYTGKEAFIRPGSKNDSDVDHIVALHEASMSGTPEWNGRAGDQKQRAEAAAFREALANDPDNTIVVGSAINRAKGDADPTTFMPPYEPAQCRYAIQVVKVKAKNKQYLSVDSAERAVLSSTLQNKCSVRG